MRLRLIYLPSACSGVSRGGCCPQRSKGDSLDIVWLWPGDTWTDLRYREEIHSFNIFFFFLPLICVMGCIRLGEYSSHHSNPALWSIQADHQCEASYAGEERTEAHNNMAVMTIISARVPSTLSSD